MPAAVAPNDVIWDDIREKEKLWFGHELLK
jgi:hypothetical protein